MDINILRSKSRGMMFKELLIALTAYNPMQKNSRISRHGRLFPPKRPLSKMRFFWSRFYESEEVFHSIPVDVIITDIGDSVPVHIAFELAERSVF